MNLSLILILAFIGIIIFVSVYWESVSDTVNFFQILLIIVAAIGFIFIQVNYSESIKYKEGEHKYYIHSLGNDKYIEGYSTIFSGSIDEVDYYFFFVNYVNGMQREKLPINKSYIIEVKDIKRPYVEEVYYKYKDENRFWKVWDDIEVVYYRIYVPENTIIRDFKVR